MPLVSFACRGGLEAGINGHSFDGYVFLFGNNVVAKKSHDMHWLVKYVTAQVHVVSRHCFLAKIVEHLPAMCEKREANVTIHAVAEKESSYRVIRGKNGRIK